MLLSCQNIGKSFAEKAVLNGVSFELQEKEFLCLLGPSGCGKTTLLRIIAGLDSLNQGTVNMQQQILSAENYMMPAQQRQIGLVFQDVALFPHLSVAQNLAFGLQGGVKAHQKRIDELLELIGLSGYANSFAHEMSGGQQQRVALARALAPSPQLIMLDEPFSSLDAQLRNQVRDELHAVLRDAGVSAILVTHDQAEAFGFADRILVLNQGNIVQEGTPEEIYQTPATPWVARFVGESNFLNKSELLDLIPETAGVAHLNAHNEILVRPEAFAINAVHGNQGNAEIAKVQFAGNHMKLTAKLKHSQNQIQLMADATQPWSHGQEIQLQVLAYRVFD